MTCPLCDAEESRPGWVGSTLYQGVEYPYVECTSCGSLYCQPMPDERALALMYGDDYAKSVAADGGVADPKHPERVVAFLKEHAAGRFVDFGCGDGRLLSEARMLGWEAIGVELDPLVARATHERTGAQVLVFSELTSQGLNADVLHLGDVIEHMTDLNRDFPRLLSLVKPGGHVLAQGPLENNASLFTAMIRWAHTMRKESHRTEMAPYHVLLATTQGQRMFFSRHGLREIDYSLEEVEWPAPSRLTTRDIRQPRSILLFVLRRLSQIVSSLRPEKWGNRYFFIGSLPE